MIANSHDIKAKVDNSTKTETNSRTSSESHSDKIVKTEKLDHDEIQSQSDSSKVQGAQKSPGVKGQITPPKSKKTVESGSGKKSRRRLAANFSNVTDS